MEELRTNGSFIITSSSTLSRADRGLHGHGCCCTGSSHGRKKGHARSLACWPTGGRARTRPAGPSPWCQATHGRRLRYFGLAQELQRRRWDQCYMPQEIEMNQRMAWTWWTCMHGWQQGRDGGVIASVLCGIDHGRHVDVYHTWKSSMQQR